MKAGGLMLTLTERVFAAWVAEQRAEQRLRAELEALEAFRRACPHRVCDALSPASRVSALRCRRCGGLVVMGSLDPLLAHARAAVHERFH